MDSIDLKTVQGLHDVPLLDAADAAALVLAVGPLFEGMERENVAVAINNAAAKYAFDYYTLSGPQLDDQLAAANDLAEKCVALLKSAGIVPPLVRERDSAPYVTADKVRRSLGRGALFGLAANDKEKDGPATVVAALQGVADLERWSRQLADWNKRKMGQAAPSATPGKDPNEALGPLLDSLHDIYIDAWDWIAGTPEKKLGELVSAEEWNPRVGVHQPKKSAHADRTGRDWRKIYSDAGIDPNVKEMGDAAAIGATDSLAAKLALHGDAMPERFLRLLCEVMFRMDRRGVPVAHVRPGTIEQAWYRWQRSKRPAK